MTLRLPQILIEGLTVAVIEHYSVDQIREGGH